MTAGAGGRGVLRIAFDHEIFVDQVYGGVSRYFCEIGRRIARLPGCRVSVLAPLHSNRHLRESGIETLGLYVPRVPGSARVEAAIARAAWPLLQRAAAPDVVHRTYYGGGSTRPRAPVIVTVHDMAHERLPALFPGDDTSRRKRAAVAAADHVICVSEATRRDLADCFGVPPSRTTVIHHGCDATGLAAPAAAAPPARPFILHVGPRAGYKNFERLLEAFAGSRSLARDFDLVAFGGGPWSAEESRRARALGLAPASLRQESGGDARLAQLYAAASLFVLPSLHEGFGIPMVEAMSFGCPVACGRTAALAEVAGDAPRYFDPGDADDIRRALEEALGSAPLRRSMCEKGRARAATFSWDATAAKTAQVYARAAGG